MFSILSHCARDPFIPLYAAQCCCYATAAVAVRFGHHSLWITYAASALIHAGLAITHHILLP